MPRELPRDQQQKLTESAIFIGHLGSGRKADIERYKIDFRFPMGGLCEILRSDGAQCLQRVLPDCLRGDVIYLDGHSDVELARCLRYGCNITGSPIRKGLMRHVYTQNITSTLRFPGVQLQTLIDQYRNSTTYHAYPRRFEYPFAVLHPVKNHTILKWLYDSLNGLTPSAIWPILSCSHSPNMVAWMTACCNQDTYTRSLVNRPMRCAQDRCSTHPPECESAASGIELLHNTNAYMVSLTPSSAHALASSVSRLMGVNVQVQRAITGSHFFENGLQEHTAGELGVKMSVLRLVRQHIRERPLADLLLFEDDVLTHEHFPDHWEQIQRSPRCADFIHSGGVLLLGASEWTHKWEVPEDVCYNALQRTCGMFATLFSHHTLPYLERWIVSSSRPLDHVYEYLQQVGFPVRVAYPNLFIANVTKDSTIKKRYGDSHTQERIQQMRWSYQQYH